MMNMFVGHNVKPFKMDTSHEIDAKYISELN